MTTGLPNRCSSTHSLSSGLDSLDSTLAPMLFDRSCGVHNSRTCSSTCCPSLVALLVTRFLTLVYRGSSVVALPVTLHWPLLLLMAVVTRPPMPPSSADTRRLLPFACCSTLVTCCRSLVARRSYAARLTTPLVARVLHSSLICLTHWSFVTRYRLLHALVACHSLSPIARARRLSLARRHSLLSLAVVFADLSTLAIARVSPTRPRSSLVVRFAHSSCLAAVGWSSRAAPTSNSGFGNVPDAYDSPDGVSMKTKAVNLISAVRTLMRCE